MCVFGDAGPCRFLPCNEAVQNQRLSVLGPNLYVLGMGGVPGCNGGGKMVLGEKGIFDNFCCFDDGNTMML